MALVLKPPIPEQDINLTDKSTLTKPREFWSRNDRLPKRPSPFRTWHVATAHETRTVIL